MKYKIIVRDSFKKELYNIIHYIDYFIMEPKIAKKKYDNIIKKIFTLEYFPEGYPKLDYTNSNFRKLIFNKYIIIYYVENQRHEVHILHIYHSSQNYLNKF